MTLNDLCELANKTKDWDSVCETAELKIQAVSDHMMWWGHQCGPNRKAYLSHVVRLLVNIGSESTDKEIQVMGALSDLYDEQNGPPLLRRQSQWERAMTASQQALGIKPHGEA